ncbi:MAG: tyrosine-type recombinase/integrase [Candidatus Binataceae bacterium]
MANITKALVERAKAPQAGQAFTRDDELTGFALRVTAAGVKSFVWEGRIKGRVRRMTLGQFPALTVFEARRRALEVKTAVASGDDPALERKRERTEPTFGDLAAAWVERHAKLKRKSWARDERRLAVHFERWNPRRLSDISREETGKLQHAIAQRHGQIASNRAITLLRAVFNWGAAEGIFTGDNPAVGLKFYREHKRERFLSPDELRRVNESLLRETDWRWRSYFPLVLMLGLRKGELLGARWQDVDLDQQTITLPETKSGHSHTLPLPAAAADLLRSLPSLSAAGWIFPGDGKTGHLVEVKSAWQRIRARAGVPDVTVHDLRRTLGSWLAASGHSLPLIGRALGHSNPSSTAIYARLSLDPVRAALEANAEAMRLAR